MGCGGSKLEEASAAVNLCRSRCDNLSEAIRLRYALADAHYAYRESLDIFAGSLHSFFLPSDAHRAGSPLLPLPTQRKGDPLSPSPVDPHSNSGHIHFISSSDEEDDEPLHSDSSPSPVHHLHGEKHKGDVDHITTFTTYNFHFAKKGPPAASVTYEQRPFGAELGHVQVGDAPTMYPYQPDPYGANQSSAYPYVGAAPAYPYAYPYVYPSGYAGGAAGGIFGPAQPPAQAAASTLTSTSTSRPPPEPPSPTRASAWDFLNPFESYDTYFQNYTPSRSSRELREEEGIPDLEDEAQEVVIKEAYGHETTSKGAASSSSAVGGKGAPAEEEEEEERSRGIVQEQHYKVQVRPGHAGENVEHDVHVVSRGVVGDDLHRAKPQQEAPQRKVVPGSRSVPDAVNEIVNVFKTVDKACLEVSRMLEVGKQQYHQKKYSVVPSRIRHIAPPILMGSLSVPKSSELSINASSAYVVDDEQRVMEAGNLSSTLQKLYIWEKKLLDEVKVEEDIRLTHERKSKKLRRMNEHGAEPYKRDSIRHVVKKLSTKIRIEIQIVHSISNRISKLRDNELWPQLQELIHGLLKMWQVLSDCHRTQRQAILEARNLDTAATQREATMKLILDLLKWSDSFFDWVDIQKSFVKELNEWLKKCLLYEPEVTADGVAPFSPGRLGAPPVFVICNYWSQAIGMISKDEVVEAMNDFTKNVLVIWQGVYIARRQHMVTPDKNRDRKALDRDNQKIHREVDAVKRKWTQVGNQGGYSQTSSILLLNNDSKPSGLHSSLQKIFEAMERFTESSLKAYEGLKSRCEEEGMATR